LILNRAHLLAVSSLATHAQDCSTPVPGRPSSETINLAVVSEQPQTPQVCLHASVASGKSLHLHGVDPGIVNPPPRITHAHNCVTPLTGKRFVVSAHTVGAAVVGETVGDADGVGEGSVHMTTAPLPLPLPLPGGTLGQVGPGVGETEGLTDGLIVGVLDGVVDGLEVGVPDGVVDGLEVGVPDGVVDGLEVGVVDGLEVGVPDGVVDGLEVGVVDGLEVGVPDGVVDGLEVGVPDGAADGANDGAKDGLSVGHNPQLTRQFAAASGYASHLHGQVVVPGLRFTQSQRRISSPPVPGTRNLPGLS